MMAALHHRADWWLRPARLLTSMIACRPTDPCIVRHRLACCRALIGAALSLSCASATSPAPSRTGNAVIIATDTNDLSVVNPSQGKVSGHIGPVPRLKSRGAISPDRSTLYLFAELDLANREIIAIDTRTLEISWRVDIAQLEQQALADSLPVSIGGNLMTTTPDGTRLLLNASMQDGEGFVVVDPNSREVTGFDPLVHVIDLAAVAPSSELPNGAVLVTGVRQLGPLVYTGLFYVLDGASLAVRDSVTVTAATDDPTGGMQQVLASPDGQYAYVVGFQQFRYDLLSHRVTDSVATPSHGWLSISPDGSTLYRSDFGSFDLPGSGDVFVYGANLTPRTPIDVSSIAPSPTAEGQPVLTGNAVPSSDGKLLYVAAGTPRIGGIGFYEPARLLELDTKTSRLVRAVPVAGSSPLVLFVR